MSINNPYEQAEEPEDPQAWREQALCAQVGDLPFFPAKGESAAEGKAVCAGCDVREQCLAYALENNERFGIWGGKSERERRAILNGMAEKRAAEQEESDARIAALHAELGSIEKVAQRLESTPRKIKYAINRHNGRTAPAAAERKG